MRNIGISLVLAAVIPAPVSAEVPPRFEMGLQCAAAAMVSTMLLRDTKAPQDLQDTYSSILASVNGMLHETAATAEMTDDEVDLEVVQRSNLLVDRINAVPNDGFQAAVFQQISMEPGGGMESCGTLMSAVTLEKAAE